MIGEVFTSKESSEVKILKLKKHMESSAFLNVYFFPQEFLEGFIPFAVQVLEGTEPEEKAPFTCRNEARYTVLRALNKFSLKNIHDVELIYVLNKALQRDNLSNAILALKALSSLSRSKIMTGNMVEIHVNVLLSVVHDLFANIESFDENLVEMSLFALIEVLSHSCVFFHRSKYYIVKIDQFLIHIYGYVRRILENRRFLDLILHKKAVSIGVCSAISKLLKLTYEHIPVIPKMSPYYMFISEVALIAVFYCPPDPAELRKEICFFVTKICVNNKEAFLPMIDKIYTLPFLFSPDTILVNIKGLNVLSEILGHFKDNLSKAAYLDFAFRASEVLMSLCYSSRRFCNSLSCENRASVGKIIISDTEVESVAFYIESIGLVLSAIENICRCFGSRSVEFVELHNFYLRSFYDMNYAFESINELVHSVRDEKELFKDLVVAFVSGFKEVIGDIGSLERSGGNVVVLSTPEIHMLYSIFERSFDIFSVEYVSQDVIIEEFFSTLVLMREHVANDIIKHCSGRLLDSSRRNESFLGAWKIMLNSVTLGNSIIMHVLPEITRNLENEDVCFVKKVMAHIVPFFSNDVKKIRKANTFFMHKLISTLMTSQPNNIQHFEILLEIFDVFGRMQEKSSFFQKYIFDNFIKIVEHLMKLHRGQSERIFIDIIFALPISINLVEADIQFLMRPIEKALRLEGSVKVKALSILVYVLDFSTSDKVSRAMETSWRGILRSVLDGLKDRSISMLCAKVLGKLKTYQKALLGDESFEDANNYLSTIALLLDGEHRIPAHSLFFEAVQNIRGSFVAEDHGFDSERSLVRFRRLRARHTSQEALACSFKFLTDTVYYLVGWGFFRKDSISKGANALLNSPEVMKNITYVAEYVYSTHSLISLLCHRKCPESRVLAQYVYDAVLALFSCYNTSFEKEARQLLHSIFGTVVLCKMFSFFRVRNQVHATFLDVDTFIDALIESFSEFGNSLPFKTLSVLFIQAYEFLGPASEDFNLEMYRTIFSKLETMCKSSCLRHRNAGINGIMCLLAIIPLKELVLLKIPEDAFFCAYLYLAPLRSSDFIAPLRLVLFILRFRYRSMKTYLVSEGNAEDMMSCFVLFVKGLFENNKHTVEFSRIVLYEILQTYAPDILQKHAEVVFEFLKQNYVMNKATFTRHLQVFVFSVCEGGCVFRETEMKYLIGKFMDSVSKEEWKMFDGIQGGFETRVDVKEDLCACKNGAKLCHKLDEGFVVNLSGIYRKVSELSVNDLIELALKGTADILCGTCKKRAYRCMNVRSVYSGNEAEELFYWMGEFYLIVVRHSKVEEEVDTAITFMFKYMLNGSLENLGTAYEINPARTKNVLLKEIEGLLSGKIDYRLLTSLLYVYSRLDIPEDPRVNILVSKILREFKVPKEFAIIAQDSKYSVLAKAFELAMILKKQEFLYGEVVDTYVMLDAYVRSYTSKIYPRILEYADKNSVPFMNHVFKKIQEPSIYNLCTRLYVDSARLREIVHATRTKFADRITQGFHGLGENSTVDMSVFVYAYKLLELAKYEMKPIDIQAVLGIYSDLRGKAKDSIGIKNLLMRCVNRFSAENFELLYKLDPLFIAVDGINPACFSGDLSISTLKNMLRSIDRKETSGFDALIDLFGDNCYLLAELFVETGFRSSRFLKYSKENLQNANIRSLLLYYLCTFEPLYVYFEVLLKMPHEDRKYTLYCLKRVVDAFEPVVFEELILVVLRSEVRSKTNLYILLPLLSCRPALIGMKIAYELIGSIHKLLNFFIYSQQKIAAELFSVLYDRFRVGEDDERSDYDSAMTNTYTLLFINFIHLKADHPGDMFQKYGLQLNLNALTYSPENMNLNNLFEFLEVELSSGKNEGYKKLLLNNISPLISPHFNLRPLSKVTVRYLVKGRIWDYGIICTQSNEGSMKYNGELLYNLLCVLCDDLRKDIEVYKEFINKEGDSAEDDKHEVRIDVNRDFVVPENKLNDMLVCSSVIRYLFGEYNKNDEKTFARYIEDGLEDILYILSVSSNIGDVLRDLACLYAESIRNLTFDVSPLLNKITFFVSDFRVTLAEKIEIILLLDSRKHDENLMCEMALPVFVAYRHSNLSMMSSLQKFFMRGLCSANSTLRNAYFDLLDSSIPRNKSMRLAYLLGMNWKHNDKVGYAIFRLLASSYRSLEIVADRYYKSAPDVRFEYPWTSQKMMIKGVIGGGNEIEVMTNFFENMDVHEFEVMNTSLFDVLYHLEASLLPSLTEMIRVTVAEFSEQQSVSLFADFIRFSGGIEDVGLLGAFVRGLEPIYKHVDLSELISVFKGGDAWFVLLEYATDRQKMEIFRTLMDSDCFFGTARAVSCFPETMQIYLLLQLGKVKEAQDLCEKTQGKAMERRISFNEKEYEEWQDEWIRCAKELQQWDACYDLGIHKGDCSLSLESMWHLSDFMNPTDVGNFRSLLNLKEKGFEKEFYGLFPDLFTEYSPEKISRCLLEGVNQLKNYPINSGIGSRLLLYFQIMIEMVESDPIFSDRIDTTEALTSILFRWRDKDPLGSDSFGQWSLFSTWRRHVCSRLVAFEENGPAHGSSRRGSPIPCVTPLKETTENNLRTRKDVAVKGVNEMARILNAFAGTAIFRGYYDVALFNLKDIFDLSSIKVVDAFQKVIYELLCLLEKGEYKLGADQCGSTNIQHFSDAQSSVLFNFKALFNEKLGKLADAEKLYLQSAQICDVVGDNWFTWATYLFNRTEQEKALERECFLALTQAITHCTGAKARRAILKLILMMRKCSSLCDVETFQKIIHEIDVSRFIYFIPQLIDLLETKNADLVKIILVGISKEYFQAVAGPLRITREGLRGKLCPKNKDYGSCEEQMKRLRMDDRRVKASKVVTEPPSESKMFFLENITGLYNVIKDKTFDKEVGKIVLHLQNTFNSRVFKEEESVYHKIKKIFDDAVSHVIHRRVLPSSDRVSLLNELISHLSSSSLSKQLKDVLVGSILGMEYLCPLENIDDLVRFKHSLRKVVEGSFYKMNKFEDSQVNLVLHRSVYKHEMFGQYAGIRSNYKNPVNIEMFEPRWSYMYRKKIGHNRIHLRGSDGKVYRYEMRGLSGTAPSEFVFPQLSFMINEAMKGNAGLSSRKAELRLFTPVVVSEVLVVECVEESVHMVDSILEERMAKYEINLDQYVLMYLNHFANIYEEDGVSSYLGHRYTIDNGLRKRARRSAFSPGECPNIRKRNVELVENVNLDEDGVLIDRQELTVDKQKNVIHRQKQQYVEGLRSGKISCLGCDDGDGGVKCIMPCKYKYDLSQRQRYTAYEKVSNALDVSGYLGDYFKSLYGELSGYFRFRMKSLLTYSTNTAFLYSFFIVDRKPENLVFTRSTARFMNRRILYESGGMAKKNSTKAMISPAYQHLFGKEGVEGLMLPIIYHYGEMLDEEDWYKDLLRVVFEENSGNIFGEKFDDALGKMMTRIAHMKDKDENGSYNVVPLVSEWMDTFKLAQADPRNLPWF